MGTIRESCDPRMKAPSSMFGFGDLPKKTDILIDDICQTVVIKNEKEGIDVLTYDEFEICMLVARNAVIKLIKK